MALRSAWVAWGLAVTIGIGAGCEVGRGPGGVGALADAPDGPPTALDVPDGEDAADAWDVQPEVPPATSPPPGSEGWASPCDQGGPHVLDGAFTGFDPLRPGGRHEWSCAQPVRGQYTFLYVDYDGEALHILNDWHLNQDAPIGPSCFNLFTFYTDGGTEQWQLAIFGDQTLDVRRNGVLVAGDGFQGMAGFGYSPNIPDRPHTIFEIRVPSKRGDFGVLLCDPEQSLESTCTVPGPGGLVTEPTFFSGRVVAGRTVTFRGTDDTPVLVGATPPVVEPGGSVTLVGLRFGGTPGRVAFPGGDGRVLAWGDDAVRVALPALAGSGEVRVEAGGVASNPLFVRVCAADCHGRACGDDGCGGSCGTCRGAQEACVDGACACFPRCTDRECGDDGCGGSCGECAGQNAVCAANVCRCIPDCIERDCGDDGCGGLCGECLPGTGCSKVGRCVATEE